MEESETPMFALYVWLMWGSFPTPKTAEPYKVQETLHFRYCTWNGSWCLDIWGDEFLPNLV